MKHFLFLLTAYIAVTNSARAQTLPPAQINTIKNQAGTKYNLHQLLQKNSLFAYQANAQIVIKDSTYNWRRDTINKTWSTTFKTLYTTYDSNNNLINYLVQRNYPNTNTWENFTTASYIYDAKNNPTTLLYRIWSGTGWTNSDEWHATYDSNNNITSLIVKIWNGSTWKDQQQFIYIYDNNNNLIINTAQIKDSTGWVNDYNYIFTYNANNTILKELNQVWENGKWNDIRQSDYTYDSNSNLTSIVDQEWNTGSWVIYSRSTYSYDSNNKTVNSLLQYWDNSVWINSSQSFYFYDASKNTTGTTSQKWNKTTSKWVPQDSIRYYFHIKTSGLPDGPSNDQHFNAYPNPFTTSASIAFASEQKNSTIKIIDILGKEIKSIPNFTGKQLVIDREGMKPGIYFIQLSSENRILTSQRIVLQQ